jgi:hypothetical protein
MNENVIRTITIKGTSEGIDKVTGDLNKLATAQQNVAVVSEQSAKRVLSLEDAWKRQTLRLDEAARSQANLARETKIADQALQQGIATQEQHAQRIDQLNQKYGQATVAQKAFGAATSGVSGQLIALSAGAGPVGTFLAGLGPWGLAAAAALGAVEAVFNRLSEGAQRFGDKAIELKKFSDVTGLTVTEIKALTIAGAQLGVSTDDVKTAVEHFSVGLAEAHKATGDLYDKIREIDPALARNLAATTTTAEGWDALAQAMKRAGDVAQRNALARAAFRRGGLEVGTVAAATADAGGLDTLQKKVNLSQELVDKAARLRVENVELEKQTEAMKDAAYAVPMLERQQEYLKAQKAIAEATIQAAQNVSSGGALDRMFAPQADEFGAPLIYGKQGGGGRGPSEGAMQAQEEAKALRDAASAQQDLNALLADGDKLIDYTLNPLKERLAVLGSTATAQDIINAKTLELQLLLDRGVITQTDFNKVLGDTIDKLGAAADAQKQSDVRAALSRAAALTAQQEAEAAAAKQKDAASQYTTYVWDAERGVMAAVGPSQNVADSTERAASAAGRQASSMRDVAASAEDAAKWQSTYGQMQGTKGTYATETLVRFQLVGQYGEGGFDEQTGAPNAQGLEYQFNRMTGSGGVTTASISALMGGGLMTTPLYGSGGYGTGTPTVDTNKIALIQRAIDVVPKEQQPGLLQSLIKQAQGLPQNLGTVELVQQLNDKLTQLTAATDANTSATSTMTDVLSPFYSSDPRSTHLGFRAFAGGGIMTQYGELPLRHYQGGGMATSPQVAVFGEGSSPEAYVPVPSGRIPVELRTPANSNQRPVQVTINVMGNANAGTVAALKATAFQQAQAMRRMIG